MIFCRAATEPTMFICLSEKDVNTVLRPGRTLFVDREMLQGQPVDKVIIAMFATDQEAINMIHKADPFSTGLPVTKRKPGPESEEQCQGCQAIVPIGRCFEGRCTVCWAAMAKTYATQNQFLQSKLNEAAAAKGSS